MAFGVIPLVPDHAAGDLWRRRPEAQAGVGADDAALQLPHGLPVVQELEEGPHADGDKDGQRGVEDEVEQGDFGCGEKFL